MSLSEILDYYHEKDTHNYGDLFSEIDYLERIIKEDEKKRLTAEFADYLEKEWNNAKAGPNSRERALKKATAILKGEEMTHIAPKIKNNANASRRKLIKQAVNKGYVKDFILHEPWHPAVFFDDNQPTTFPFQHEYAVFYSGQPRHVFFSTRGKKEIHETYTETENGEVIQRPRNPHSILIQGELKPGNRHQRIGNKNYEDKGPYANAIYGSTLNIAAGKYAGGEYYNSNGPTFELLVDTNNLAVMPRGGTRIDGEYRPLGTMHNLEEIINSMKKPEILKNMVEEESKKATVLELKYRKPIPLQHILGIWDTDIGSGEPQFLSLETYVELLYERYPERMPARKDHGFEADNIEKDVIQKAHVIDKARDSLHHETDISNTMSLEAGRMARWIRGGYYDFSKENIEELEEMVERYNQRLGKIHNYLNDKIRLEKPKKNTISVNRPEEAIKELKHLGEFVEEKDEEIEKLFQKIVELAENNPDSRELEEAEELERKAVETFFELPYIEADFQKMGESLVRAVHAD